MANRSAPNTKQINKHLNKKVGGLPKAGASNGVGRLAKQKGSK